MLHNKIEQFLPEDYQKLLKDMFESNLFPWYYQDYTHYHDIPEDLFMFTHNFYNDNKQQSTLYDVIKDIPIFFEEKTKLKIKRIERIKANLLTRHVMTEEHFKKTIHKDMDDNEENLINYKNYVSMIYYINDSDGDTILYDNDLNIIEKCTPKQGTAFWFKSIFLHTATNPLVNKRRMIINFILELYENQIRY